MGSIETMAVSTSERVLTHPAEPLRILTVMNCSRFGRSGIEPEWFAPDIEQAPATKRILFCGPLPWSRSHPSPGLAPPKPPWRPMPRPCITFRGRPLERCLKS